MRQLRCDHLPALRPFLTNQNHPGLLGLRPSGVDDAHQDTGITEDPHTCFTHSRTSKTAGTRALWNDVFFIQQTAVEAAADEIVGDNATQRRGIAFSVRFKPIALYLLHLILGLAVRSD